MEYSPDSFQSGVRAALLEPKYDSLIQMILASAANRPGSPAISQGDRRWTYSNLISTASALARRIAPGEVVAVTGQQSFGMVAGVLAVLSGGGVLLTVDPKLPERRQKMLVEQASARRLLIVGAVPAWAEGHAWDDIINVEPHQPAADGSTALAAPAPNDPGYIFFTSGSTGLPKGVLGCHKGLSHFLTWQRDTFGVGPNDRVAQLTNLSFDVVLRSILLGLVSGGTLCLPPEFVTLAGSSVLPWMQSAKITIVHTVPSLAQSWLMDVPRGVGLPDLRWTFFAGEPLHDLLVRQWRMKFPSSRIVNLYGPTETTMAKFFYIVPTEPDPGRQPVGWPLPQTQGLLLDEQGALCGPGHAGEIAVRTPFRTLGYINAKEEQQRRFVPNPFRDDPADLIYQTGDRGRYREDGALEILGRMDFQVKIQGVRVEPEEVSAVLLGHPGVQGCVVVARPGATDKLILVAYVVGAGIRQEELRDFLSGELPAAMVPSFFLFLDRLPLTANGKVDRAALPAPNFTRAFVAPRTELEQALAGMWQQVLGVQSAGLDDNFFELGGHSLSAMQIGFQIRERLNVEFPLGAFLTTPVLRAQAEKIEEMLFKHSTEGELELALEATEKELAGKYGNSAPAENNSGLDDQISNLTDNLTLNERLSRLSLPDRARLALNLTRASRQDELEKTGALPRAQVGPENRFEPFPLSDIQEAYLIGREEGVELGNIACHNYFEVDIEDWDHERFEAALNKLIARHDMLRCIVLPEGRQQILKEVPKYQVDSKDLRGQSTAAVDACLDEIRQEMSHYVHPTDIWPLFDFRATILGPQCTRLHIGLDLLIADGRSFEIICGELGALYRDLGAVLPSLELSFRDYLEAFNRLEETKVFRTSRDYWVKRLPSLPAAPDLPFAVQPASIQKPIFKRRRARLDRVSWNSIKEKSMQTGLTPAGILVATYAEVLGIWSKSPDLTINLTLFNRLPLHEHANDIIGDFTSVDLLEVKNSLPEGFQARARRSQEQLWEDLDHRYFSGVRVIRELSRFQAVGPKAIMPVVFTSLLNLGNAGEEATWVGHLGKLRYTVGQTPQVSLDFMVQESGGDLVINWDSVEELFPAGLLDDMFTAYQRLLHDLETDDSAWQRTLAENARRLIPAAQIAVRNAANNTAAPITEDLLHTPFLRQVAERPEQLAVITPKRALTYLETYRYARRIEQELLRCGVQPNDFVAVMMEKGWEQIAAVLGTHFAGAAYVPIDPELPAERQRLLLEHTNAKVALTQSSVRGRLNVPASVEVFEVDQLKPADDTAPMDRRRQKPQDLAYVIYTSGSTGLPKGVMIDHLGALNTVLDVNQRFSVGPNDRTLAVSRLSFDLSVYDIFGLLAAGGAVVMPAPDLAYDASHWAELIRKEKVTIWNTVPALLQLLVDQAGKPELLGDSLRVAMMSGDWIPLGLPDQVRRVLPKVNVISLGGATEASIWSILYPIGKVDANWKSIPYGKAMLNQSFHVLGQDSAPCPTWVPGQLYIGGVGLAKGYLHDEQKTNSSFVINPTNGERLYRTGDLGRYLPDGNIEFLGREDFQVKVQGYRIELGEIEARLQEYPGVDLCVAIVREDTPGEKRLAGYVVAKPGVTIDPEQVKEHLRKSLPEYMVPVAIITLERFPLTPNGKVDRKALPAPARSTARTGSESLAHRDPLDLQLTKLWEKILNVRPIGLRDNFFDLGGNSLAAVRLFSEMRKLFDRSFPLSVLFQAPTVEKLADMIRKGGWTPQWTSLVPIQPGGSKPPFFCIHGGGGNVLIYRELARQLGKDYPFYGLQARGLDENSDCLTTIEDMAEAYLKELLKLQPEGPYHLGGFCMGGQVAFEIAQRLVWDGQKVNLLFLMDTHIYNPVRPRVERTKDMVTAGPDVSAYPSVSADSETESRSARVGGNAKLALRRQVERLRIAVDQTFKVHSHRDVSGTREEYIARINDRAYLAYAPCEYAGKITVCQAHRKLRFLRDPQNGWGGVGARGVEIIELRVEPGALFVKPHVQQLAEILREKLDQAAPLADASVEIQVRVEVMDKSKLALLADN